MHPSTLQSKPKLTKELTTTFIENFNSKHGSGKALRNKKKPSCLVLDDFCIDYHNTNVNSKSERNVQFLKPKTTSVKEFKETGGQTEDILNGENVGIAVKNEIECEKNDKESKDKLKSNEADFDISCQRNEESNGSQKSFNISTQIPKSVNKSRYSKRTRSGKAKHFSGSEHNLKLDKKLQYRSKVNERKRRLKSKSCKPLDGMDDKDGVDRYPRGRGSLEMGIKMQQNKEEFFFEKNWKNLKRSERIKHKRSILTENASAEAHKICKGNANAKVFEGKTGKLDKTNDFLLDEKGGSFKSIRKEKVSKSFENVTKSHNDDDEKEFCCEKNAVGIAMEKHIKDKGIVTKTDKGHGDRMRKEIFPSKSPKKSYNSPEKAQKKKLPFGSMKEKITELCDPKVDRTIKSDTIIRSKIDKDCKMLLCDEPSFQESSFDHIKSQASKVAVLRTAERILGGRIRLLCQESELKRKGNESESRETGIKLPENRNEMGQIQHIFLVKETGMDKLQTGEANKYVRLDLKEAGFTDKIGNKSGKKSVEIEVSASKLREFPGEKCEEENNVIQTVRNRRGKTYLAIVRDKNAGKKKMENNGLLNQRIVNNKSNKIVSIQSTAGTGQQDEEKANKDKVHKSWGQLPMDNGLGSAPGVSDESLQIVGLAKNNLQSIDTGDVKNEAENDSCCDELYLSGTNCNKKENEKRFVCEKKISKSRLEAKMETKEEENNTLLSKDKSDIKSVYAQLSFQRLLASVQAETAKSKVQSRSYNSPKGITKGDRDDEGATEMMQNQRIFENIVVEKPNILGAIKCQERSINENEEKTNREMDDKQPQKGALFFQALQNACEIRSKQSIKSTLNSHSDKSCPGPNVDRHATEDKKILIGFSENFSKKEALSVGSLDGEKLNAKLEEKESCINVEKGSMSLEALEKLKREESGKTESNLQRLSMNEIDEHDSVFALPTEETSSPGNDDFLICSERKYQRMKINSFKAETEHKEKPLKFVSGLKSIEKKMMLLSKEKVSRQNSVIEKSSQQLNDFLKQLHPNHSIKDMGKVEDRSPDFQVNKNLIYHIPGPSECLSLEKTASKHRIVSWPEKVGDSESGIPKRRRKGLKPKRHIPIVKAHHDTHLLNEKVKATLLKFDGRKNGRQNNDLEKTDNSMVKVTELSEGKSPEDKIKQSYIQDLDALKTVYSVGKVRRKAYKHAKLGLRKYPLPNRSRQKYRTDNYAQFLSNILEKKSERQEGNCDMNALKRASSALEQGEELLKQMFDLNKGIFLTRKDVSH